MSHAGSSNPSRTPLKLSSPSFNNRLAADQRFQILLTDCHFVKLHQHFVRYASQSMVDIRSGFGMCQQR